MKDREIFEKETGWSLTTTGIGPTLSYWKAYAKWLEKRSEWVSVEDRLPTEDELFEHNNSGFCWIMIDDGAVQIGSYYDSEDSFDESGFSHSGVTHWMPLISPTPPDEAKRGRG